MNRKPVVRVVPYQPHCFAFGGFEIQMISALAAVQAQGYDAGKMDFWSQNDDFDILHVWGYGLAHLPAVYWARKSGKRVVMSALLGYPTFKYKLSHFISSRYGIGRKYQELIDLVDCFSVVNDQQAETAIRILGIPDTKVAVIPNIVEAKYFDPPPGLTAPIEIDKYILCTGNVCPRKNQLALAQACVAANFPLLIIGDVLLGEETYGESLSVLIQEAPLINWIRKVDPGSDVLIAAYQYCAAFALPSFNETQPISLLEASALQKPLLIADRPYAKQKCYVNALTVEPESVSDIRRGLEQIVKNGNTHVTPQKTIEDCRLKSVGAAYGRLFELVMDRPAF
ncbi:MAG: glycosyltransferase family 4 protein [Thiotrichales bacterium]|nr:glycosyltransferase family 4 protein [Thiotrichales bacterium]